MNEELRREIDRFAAENEQAIFADTPRWRSRAAWGCRRKTARA